MVSIKITDIKKVIVFKPLLAMDIYYQRSGEMFFSQPFFLVVFSLKTLLFRFRRPGDFRFLIKGSKEVHFRKDMKIIVGKIGYIIYFIMNLNVDDTS